jgi:hypothetical protein
MGKSPAGKSEGHARLKVTASGFSRPPARFFVASAPHRGEHWMVARQPTGVSQSGHHFILSASLNVPTGPLDLLARHLGRGYISVAGQIVVSRSPLVL